MNLLKSPLMWLTIAACALVVLVPSANTALERARPEPMTYNEARRHCSVGNYGIRLVSRQEQETGLVAEVYECTDRDGNAQETIPASDS